MRKITSYVTGRFPGFVRIWSRTLATGHRRYYRHVKRHSDTCELSA